jgi:hypothetical protein
MCTYRTSSVGSHIDAAAAAAAWPFAVPRRISPMYLVSHLAVPQLGVVLLGDAGEASTAVLTE